MLIKNYNYSEKEISTILTDNVDGEYLWVGFKSDGSNCLLEKVSAHDPKQKYFTVDIPVSKITKGILNDIYLYLSFNDSTYLGRRYSRSNPLSSYIDFEIPTGITEQPVDILVNTDVFFLIPGDISGTNAKIVKMTTTGTFTETIDLSTVYHAKSFTIDSATGDIWIITYTSPATYVRVYLDGGIYKYTINS